LNVKGLTFAPPGVRPDRHVVALDPSVVFGDGAHPTTIACLEEIHEIMRTQEITRALDLGCGTGILSLAVAGWGAAHVCAVDKNRLAVRTTKANVILNGREDTIEVIEGEARAHIVEPYDLVAANLPFSILRDLLQTQSAGIHRFWVVSGINETQSAVLQELFRDLGYTILGERSSAPWTTFTAKKEFGSTQ
jgi:ribosomal protein L11 methyltransferase